MNTPSLLGSVALVFSTGIVLGGVCSVAIHLAWPLVERSTTAWHPRWRERAYAAVAAAPVLVPALFLLLCLLPGLAAHWTSRADHCAIHHGHPHLCLIHPSIALSPLLSIGPLLFILGVTACAVAVTHWLIDARRDRRYLDEESRRIGAGLGPGLDNSHVQIVPSQEIFALTGGILRPRIWVSSALDALLTPSERKVVVAHEQAHVDRRDPLRALVTRLLAQLHVPTTQRAILDALRLASEQDCDARAARVVGDRLHVAETLLRVENLILRSARSPRSRAMTSNSVAGSHVPRRVRRLLGEEVREPSLLQTSSLIGIAIVGALLSVMPLHHLAEHVIATLLHFF